MKPSRALARWRLAHTRTKRARADYDGLGVGPNPTLARYYLTYTDECAAHEAQAYTALTPEERAVADKETSP